jgi:hypothetical protein
MLMRSNRFLLLGLVLSVGFVTPSRADQSPSQPTRLPISQPVSLACKSLPNSEPFTRSELFFGLSKPDGGTISRQEFQTFIDREVTPRFPNGLTLLSGLGQFKNTQGKIIQEKSQLLILLYSFKENGNSQKIEQIRQAYKTTFQQESVLRVDSISCVSF